VADEVRVPIKHEADIVIARQEGRALAARLGFSNIDQTLIATAISEVARNIVIYAESGEILLCPAAQVDGKRGLIIIAQDKGPGIPDITLAMQNGYSTANSLGLGLPGAKRMMDEFDIVSEVGKGTTVIMKKWKH
jgi:serine/threonine-protein kinase RsbT